MRYNHRLEKLVVLVVSILLVSGAISTAADAAEKNTNDYKMNEVVVTATATPVSSTMKTNAAVNIITREEIQAKHYQNLQELLEHIPGYGGFMAANGIGFEVSSYTQPYMRGTNKTIVLIDGVKQDIGGRFYSANAIRNVDDIERVEVLKGTASTLYGAEAVGGVINIITRKHYPTTPKTKLSISGGSYRTQTYQTDFYGDDHKSFWSLSALDRHQGPYSDANGRRRSQDADLIELDLKYGIHLNPTNDITFKYVNHNQDQTYVEGRGGGFDSPGDGTFRYNTVTAIWDAKATNKKWNNSLSFYRGAMLNDRIVYAGNRPGTKNWTEKSRQATWSITNRYYNQLTKHHRLSTGFEYYSSFFKGLPSAYASNLQGKYDLIEKSIYLQDEWNITNKFKFTAGARYAKPSITKSKTLSSFDLGYSFNKNAMVYISSKEYMSYPSFSWMHGYKTAIAIYKPSPDLKPQTGTTNEIGTKVKIDKHTYFDIAYYDRRQKDSISAVKVGREDNSTVNMYENIKNPLHIRGVEVNLVKDFGNYVTATLGYNHLNADKEELISNMAANTYSLDLRYQREKYDIGIDGLGRYDIARSTTLINNGIKLPQPNFWVWNLYGNYKVNERVKVWTRVNNLFNKFYMFTPEWDTKYDEPRYYSKPGRNIMVGVEYTF